MDNKNEEQWTFKTIIYIVLGITLLTFSIFVSMNGLGNTYCNIFECKPAFDVYKLECDFVVFDSIIFNKVWAAEFNLTKSILENVTYAYLYNHTFRCPPNSQDCFLEMAEWECNETKIIDDEMLYFSSSKFQYMGEAVSGLGMHLLTIDWLDDNCECLFKEITGQCFWIDEPLDDENLNCLAYECEDYTIEVVR